MKDTSIIDRKIHDTVMNLCFEAIVCEAFINGLPIEQSQMTDDRAHNLAMYATEALRDLGGYKLMDEAMESCKDPVHKARLSQMIAVCNEAATSVTSRILEENKDDDEALKDSTNHIALTEAEYNKFSHNAAKLSPDTLSKMIQTKTLDAIKSEKEAYAKDAELENEIVEALNTTDDSADTGSKIGTESTLSKNANYQPAMGSYGITKPAPKTNLTSNGRPMSRKPTSAFDSYMRSSVGTGFQTRHSSVFSRLQEMAYESLLCTTESYTDIPYDTMTAITKECTFPKFKSNQHRTPQQCLDSVCRFAVESLGTPDGAQPPEGTEAKLEDSLLTASIIYTFFETLNTMNLYCPKLPEIRAFVDNAIPLEAKVEVDKETFLSALKQIVLKSNNTIRCATTVPELDEVEKSLTMVREKCNVGAFESQRAMINEKLDGLQKNLDTKRDSIILKSKPAPIVMESFSATQSRVNDILKLSRIAKTTAVKPTVSYVKCKINPHNNSKYIAVETYTADNQLYSKGVVTMESYNGDGDNLVNYVQSLVEGSRLMSLDKRVMVTDACSGKIYMDAGVRG